MGVDMLHTDLAGPGGAVRAAALRCDEQGAVTDKPVEKERERELHFSQLVGILLRRFWLVLVIAASGTMLATVTGLLIPPKYTAYVQLVVEPQKAGPTAEASPTEESIDTHVSLLASRDHLQRVAETLVTHAESDNVTTRPRRYAVSLQAGAYDSSPVSTASPRLNTLETDTRGGLLSDLRRHLDIWLSALVGSGSETAARLEELERGTRVNQERRSRVITVAFTSPIPEKAAAFANRIVQVHIDNQSEQKRGHTGEELTRLRERLAELKSEMDRAVAAVQKLVQHRLAITRNAAGDARESDGQLRELERKAADVAAAHGSLARREKELRDQQEMIAPGVRILSLASVPDRPSSHNPLHFILPAMIVFGIIGCLVAVLLEQLDTGLRSERDVRDTLGMPCLGLVPRLPLSHHRRPRQHLLANPFSAYTEAIRSTAVTLQLTDFTTASKVILISSSVPREGKTTLAVSIAAYVAQIGRRVLLIDLDFRHPSTHHHLGSTAKRGVADLILNGGAAEDVIQHIPDLSLDYIPMPRCDTDPVAFFANEGLPRLLKRWRDHYDCILIDGPPLFGATEARLLARLADKVLFIVKWGSTRRDVALHAINLLRCSDPDGGNSVGSPVAVVTQVHLQRHARYRYGDVGETLVKYRKSYSRATGA
jgi:uncharacterized protein involved in exopolysaccharide biosynthesis/Mrp family chromosome partitioning ATPase